MKLFSLAGNTQRLDGGSMFGNCPRAVWARWCPPDELNRIPLACRSLLVREPGGRNVLFETGIGAFFEPRLRERYGVQESEHVLLGSLRKVGLETRDIDVVVLSHLHFDHAGGVLCAWEEGQPARLAFENATFVVGEAAFERARDPALRDRASFIPELPDLLENSGRLELVGGKNHPTLGEGYSFRYSDGHTPGLLLTRIGRGSRAITFVGDLIPGVPWVHLPITMGYDRAPELLIEEKRALLEEVLEEGSRIFLTHDPEVAACRLARDERGRFSACDAQASLESDRDLG